MLESPKVSRELKMNFEVIFQHKTINRTTRDSFEVHDYLPGKAVDAALKELFRMYPEHEEGFRSCIWTLGKTKAIGENEFITIMITGEKI